MVGTACCRRFGITPIGRWSEPDADTGATSHWAHEPNKCNRPVHPSVAFEARAKVDDFDSVAVGIDMVGDKYRGISKIGLRCLHRALEINLPKSICSVTSARSIIEQRRKCRIAVHPGNAAPYVTTGTIDQSRNLTIADRPKFERSGHIFSNH